MYLSALAVFEDRSNGGKKINFFLNSCLKRMKAKTVSCLYFFSAQTIAVGGRACVVFVARRVVFTGKIRHTLVPAVASCYHTETADYVIVFVVLGFFFCFSFPPLQPSRGVSLAEKSVRVE